MTSIDAWNAAENALTQQEGDAAYGDAVAAMRWLVEQLKRHPKICGLQPSVSHVSLVFRCPGDASVWLPSVQGRTYKVSRVVGPDLETIQTTLAGESSVVEVVSEYLENLAGC